MGKTHRSPAVILTLTAMLALTALAPIRATAQEYAPVLAPDAMAWGESSGYNGLEASRANASALILASAPDSAAASGYGALDVNRVLAARRALTSGDIGSGQEDALTDLVIAANTAVMTWAEESGYNTVEASRASMSGRIGVAVDETYPVVAPHHNG